MLITYLQGSSCCEVVSLVNSPAGEEYPDHTDDYVPLISALFCVVIITSFGLLQSHQWVIDSPLTAHRHLIQGQAPEQALPTHPRLPGQTMGHPEAPPRQHYPPS